MESYLTPPQRVPGLDLARGLALLGMLFVNFDLVVSGLPGGPPLLVQALEGLQGRAAATFVVLAGVGGSLGARRAWGDPAARRLARTRLLRRGALLLAGGTLFLTVWPADILHYYGVWLALGAGLVFAPAPAIGAAAVLATLGGVAFSATGRFLEPWNLWTLEYRGLWEPAGFARNLLLDGFHPVLPWFALYAAGLLLGRAALTERATRMRLAALGAAGVAVSWTLALLLPGDGTLAAHLATPRSFPPTPNFVLMGASAATLVIVASISVAERFPRATAPVANVGRLALTLYVAHVIVGMGTLEELGLLGGQSRAFATWSALAFFAGSVVFAAVWLRFFRAGPFEALLRAVGPRAPAADVSPRARPSRRS
ncbi:MAG: DUF418 domain-containing protein [Planctomycetota bacterium]